MSDSLSDNGDDGESVAVEDEVCAKLIRAELVALILSVLTLL